MPDVDALMRRSPVIPVLVIDRIEDAQPIAEALVAGGLPLLEVTLRTPVALEAMREMTQVPGAIVGAGSVLSPRHLDKSLGAGATFIVSPGLTETLARAAAGADIPFLPAIANPTDILIGLDLGIDRFKFFPAEAIGGLAALRANAGVFREVRFCPTGGLTAETAPT